MNLFTFRLYYGLYTKGVEGGMHAPPDSHLYPSMARRVQYTAYFIIVADIDRY